MSPPRTAYVVRFPDGQFLAGRIYRPGGGHTRSRVGPFATARVFCLERIAKQSITQGGHEGAFVVPVSVALA